MEVVLDSEDLLLLVVLLTIRPLVFDQTLRTQQVLTLKEINSKEQRKVEKAVRGEWVVDIQIMVALEILTLRIWKPSQSSRELVRRDKSLKAHRIKEEALEAVQLKG
jgi:hypothetical protein